MVDVDGPGTISGFENGIRVMDFYGHDLMVQNVSVYATIAAAFAIEECLDCTFSHDSATTAEVGFKVDKCLGHCLFEFNSATYIRVDGFQLDGIFIGGGPLFDVHDNQAENNGRYGILMRPVKGGSTIAHNAAHFNVAFDLFQDRGTCGTNRWVDNNFNTANLSCIH